MQAAEDLEIALVKFKSGANGIIEGITDIYPQNLEEILYLFDEKGTVKAGGQSVNRIEEWRFSDALDEPKKVIARFAETPSNVYGFEHTINLLLKDVQLDYHLKIVLL